MEMVILKWILAFKNFLIKMLMAGSTWFKHKFVVIPGAGGRQPFCGES